MSKKIDRALAELIKALRLHALVAQGGGKSVKKTQRISARLTAAASAYAEIVHAKAGLTDPFNDVVAPGLPPTTIASLEAERDQLADQRKSKENANLKAS